MPTYEYRCPKGHTFELFQRMSDDPPNACEVCGASPVERMLFAPTIHFKGKGFYSTDYGRNGRKRETGEGGESKPSDEKASTSADAAPKEAKDTSSSKDSKDSKDSKGSSGSSASD